MYRDGGVRIGWDGVKVKTSGSSAHAALVMPSIAGGGEDRAPGPGPPTPTSGEIDRTKTKSSDQR